MGEFDGFFRTHATPVWNYLRRLTGDPIGAMHRHAGATAHGDAIDQRNIGLRKVPDGGIELVFRGEERLRRCHILQTHLVNGADVAPGTEGAPGRSIM